MRIQIKIPQRSFDSVIHQLHSQMGYCGTNVEDGAITVMIGDKFNVYIYPVHQAMFPHTARRIEILPKDTPV